MALCANVYPACEKHCQGALCPQRSNSREGLRLSALSSITQLYSV